MRFGVLGPLEVRGEQGERIAVPRRKERALLGILLVRANEAVSTDTIVDALWAGGAPASVMANLHSYVADLRRLLDTPPLPGRDRIRTAGHGYLLAAGPDEVDAADFARLAADGRSAAESGDPGGAEQLLARAVGLWRGRVLEGTTVPEFLAPEVTRLEELRLAAVEDWMDARLALGHHPMLPAELRALTETHPLRERLWGQLMLALYRSGRRGEALEAYQIAYKLLAAELGVEPGPQLQALHRLVLAGDGSLTLRRPSPRQPVPRQLPPDVSGFTGRDTALDVLDGLLSEPAGVVVTLTGMAGVGKSALAVHWAHRVADRFPGGQLFLNLNGYAPQPAVQPAEALSRLLRSLGVPGDDIPGDEEEAAGLYRTLLADKPALVILDNAAHPDQLRALLPGGPSVVLVTSRDRLSGLVARDGARRIPLDVLSRGEAVALLGRLVDPAALAAEPDALDELADRCADLPLALRIAAATFAGHAHASIAEHSAAIARGRLAALQVEGDRQAAVRAAFDLSYTALPEPERRLFRLLGLTPGLDVDLAAAAALAGDPAVRVESSLDRLAAASLLERRRPGRYTFHDLLRSYAAERARDEDTGEDRQAALERLFGHYLSHVDAAAAVLYPHKLRLPMPAGTPATAAFAAADDARAWLDAEHHNLTLVAGHAADHGPRPVAWHLADSLRMYFHLGEKLTEWQATAEAGARAASSDGDPRAQAAASLSLGMLRTRQSRSAEAINHLAEGIGHARRGGWVAGEASLLNVLGYTEALDLGSLLAAERHLRQAMALFAGTDRNGYAATLGNLGDVYLGLGRLADAEDHLIRALSLYRDLGDQAYQGAVLGELGRTRLARGDTAAALADLHAALDLQRLGGFRVYKAYTLGVVARVHAEVGSSAEARQFAESAVALSGDLGHRRSHSRNVNALAIAHQAGGTHRMAADLHQQALDMARETGDRGTRAEALLGLAGALAHLGDPAAAISRGEEALALARATGYHLIEYEALSRLSAAHLSGGDPAKAAELAQRAVDRLRPTGARPALARALTALGDATARSGDPDGGRRYLSEAATLHAPASC